MKNTYQFTHLFEINSHSLFSKWFSESGKLVMKMFETIQNVIESGSNLVVVLIDEVESIAYARGSVSTNEPSDAIRVVNSVLTQLDRIKKYPNVLVIATSNLTSSIDPAFLDRADVVRHIGHPTKEAIEKVIESTLMELSMKGIIEPDQKSNHTIEKSKKKLTEISQSCVGFSGRVLRKLPFLAHALFLKKESSSLAEYLVALKKAVEYQKHSKMIMGLSSKTTTNGIH
jgi:pachytene checkpoint protein 2